MVRSELILVTDQRITIELSPSEALVLFEFLSRFSGDGILKILDQAEERVLWDVCATLESSLSQPFTQDYGAVLAKARSDVRDKDD